MNNITEQELKKLRMAADEEEWNHVCDEIKNARNGAYPGDWFTRVVMTGLLQQKERQFNGE